MIHPRKNSVRDKVIGKKWIYLKRSTLHRGFPGGSEGKECARNAGDLGLILELGRSSGEGNATHSSILAWRIPWTEKPGRLQFMVSQKVSHD